MLTSRDVFEATGYLLGQLDLTGVGRRDQSKQPAHVAGDQNLAVAQNIASPRPRNTRTLL